MEAALIVLEGTHKDNAIPLPETIFLVGRDKQCHLRPHCDLVSKMHCAIAAWAGKVRVRDFKSRNGTYLNGQRINGEVTVSDGDKLQIGTLLFAFRIKNDDGLPHAAPLSKGKVQWLLDTPPDNEVLAPEKDTCFLPAVQGSASTETKVETEKPPAPAPPAPAASQGPMKKRKSKVVSAGQHLHDYFNKRRRPTAVSTPPEVMPPGPGAQKPPSA